MTKSVATAILFLFISQNIWAENSTSFTQAELKTLSPFDEAVQLRVLKDVIQIMGESYDPEIKVPEIRPSESVKESETEILEAAESQGMPGWALAKGINMYLFKIDLIVLGEEMKIHNLAHEYAHYVQLKYKEYPVEQFSMDYTEIEAVNVQRNFWPEK